MFLPGPEFWGRLLGILMIDLVLAGDNALVIALALRGLPRHLQALGAVWGTAGAIVFRVACAFVASAALRVPSVQLVAAALLIGIAIRLIQPRGTPEHPREARGLAEAVWLIAAADTAMSLDNVLAIAAVAAGELSLMVTGVVLSLPLMMWGSWALATMMDRHRWLVWAGAGVLGYAAGEMALRDVVTETWLSPGLIAAAGHVVPAGLGVGIAALGWWLVRRR